jgi:hypothetical protein
LTGAKVGQTRAFHGVTVCDDIPYRGVDIYHDGDATVPFRIPLCRLT